MIKKSFFIGMFLALNAMACFAQGDDFGIWTSVGLEKKLFPNFNVSAGGEFRTQDNTQKVERWSGNLGVSYNVFKHLEAAAEYVYMYNNIKGRTTSKGNYVSSYWTPRHRFNLSLEGDVDAGNFNFSLRERYQYTYRPEKSVSKYDADGSQKADEIVTGKGTNLLRTRPQIKYNIPHSKFKPYASVEFYHSLKDFAIDKTRIKAGTSYKLNKRNVFDFYYLFQNKADDDEPRGHFLGLGYTYKFK
jgi:hypothetical protein